MDSWLLYPVVEGAWRLKCHEGVAVTLELRRASWSGRGTRTYSSRWVRLSRARRSRWCAASRPLSHLLDALDGEQQLLGTALRLAVEFAAVVGEHGTEG
jgi:hypothetical protein